MEYVRVANYSNLLVRELLRIRNREITNETTNVLSRTFSYVWRLGIMIPIIIEQPDCVLYSLPTTTFFFDLDTHRHTYHDTSGVNQ